VRDPKFANLLEEIHRWEDRASPVGATDRGIHAYDHLVDEMSREAVEGRAAEMRLWLGQLEALDAQTLSPAERVDWRETRRRLRASVRSIERHRLWESSPGAYAGLAVRGVHLLLLREFAPVEERMRPVLARLRQVPRVLAQGQANVARAPRVFLETALGVIRGGIRFFSDVVPRAAEAAPTIRDEVARAARGAAASLEAYAEHLRTNVEAAEGGFAVGRELFTEMLQDGHLLSYDADALYEEGRRLFDRTLADLETAARRVDRRRTWREIQERLKDDHPPADSLLDAYRAEMARGRAFVVSQGLLDLPEGEELRVIPTPDFLRPLIPYAAYLMPAPYEDALVGHFYVTVPDPQAPDEVRRQVLRGHPRAGIPLTALHEGYPGHHAQLATACRAPTDTGRRSHSTLFIEGWAFYCEELMERLGYVRAPEQRLVRLADQLWRAGRIMLDAALHTRGMTVEEAVEFVVSELGHEHAGALAEVRRYAATPTQPMSYLIGKLEIQKIADAYRAAKGEAFDLGTFHRELLAGGSYPPALVRERLGLG
jgi:uncharacterized protein (DUF885 family)